MFLSAFSETKKCNEENVNIHYDSDILKLFLFGSALSCVADESGVRHILLCRVIMGKSEVVLPGSKQFHPSSNEFDSGVDNLLSPRKYIIWNAFMNSHIFPEFVISFKSPCLKGKF